MNTLKTSFKAIAFALLLIGFASCNRYIERGYPRPNKDVFAVSETVGEDTLYSFLNQDFSIYDFLLKKNNVEVAKIAAKDGLKEIKDGKKTIGNIEYKNGEFYKISINGWCTIRKDESGKHKKAYIIKGEGAKDSPYTMYLAMMADKPVTITIK